jgi:hypothetical protein
VLAMRSDDLELDGVFAWNYGDVGHQPISRRWAWRRIGDGLTAWAMFMAAIRVMIMIGVDGGNTVAGAIV